MVPAKLSDLSRNSGPTWLKLEFVGVAERIEKSSGYWVHWSPSNVSGVTRWADIPESRCHVTPEKLIYIKNANRWVITMSIYFFFSFSLSTPFSLLFNKVNKWGLFHCLEMDHFQKMHHRGKHPSYLSLYGTVMHASWMFWITNCGPGQLKRLHFR